MNNIDVFVGGLAEDRVPGSQLGELFQAIIVDQFVRVRDGDSFWYEARFSEEIIQAIEHTTLADVIMRNSDVDYLQSNAMMAYNRFGGTANNNVIHGTEGRDLIIGFDGNDVLHGKGGDDEIFGGQGRDMINGGNGDDILHGGDGNDQLYGGAGSDILNGDGGDDILTGGVGADQFVFAISEAADGKLSMQGSDFVMDFHLSEGDQLVFEGVTHFQDLQDHVNVNIKGQNMVLNFDGGGSVLMMHMPGMDSLVDFSEAIITINTNYFE